MTERERLLGKRILVDVQTFDAKGVRTKWQNFSGEIVGVSDGSIAIRRDDNGATEELAATEMDVENAPRDTYTIRGIAVTQPDLLAVWTHSASLSGHSRITVERDPDLPPGR